MSAPQSPPSVEAAVQGLTRDVEALPGVQGVEVALGGEREVTRLQVRVGAEAAPAIVANAAGHVLRTRGFDFAPDAIRVVPAVDGGSPRGSQPPRPRATAPEEPAPPVPSRRRSDPGYRPPVLETAQPADRPPESSDLRRPRPRTRGAQDPAPSEAPAAAARKGAGSRYLVLSDLSIARSASRVTCTVRVRRDGQLHEASATELDSEAGRARAGARAALDASSQAAAGLAFGLEGAVLLDVFGRRHVAIAVEAVAGRRVATLSGMVAVDASRSVEEAGAMAALRAIERWIAW